VMRRDAYAEPEGDGSTPPAAPVETPAEPVARPPVPSPIRSFDDVAPPPPSSAPIDIPPARGLEPDIPLRPRTPPPAPPARSEQQDSGEIDIDLNDVLSQLQGSASPKPPPGTVPPSPPPRS